MSSHARETKHAALRDAVDYTLGEIAGRSKYAGLFGVRLRHRAMRYVIRNANMSTCCAQLSFLQLTIHNPLIVRSPSCHPLQHCPFDTVSRSM